MKHEKLFAVVESPRVEELLADWRWLVKGDVSLVAVTAMGDLVLKDVGGRIHFLDTMEGTFISIAEDETGYRDLLKSSEFRQRQLQYYAVLLLIDDGVKLGPNQCYSPDVPPHLGGELDSENLKPTDIYVHFSMSGQLWRQTKDLPAGTRIDAVTMRPDGRGLFARPRNIWLCVFSVVWMLVALWSVAKFARTTNVLGAVMMCVFGMAAAGLWLRSRLAAWVLIAFALGGGIFTLLSAGELSWLRIVTRLLWATWAVMLLSEFLKDQRRS